MRWLSLPIVVVLLFGCQRAATIEAPKQPPVSAAPATAKEEGDEAASRKDWTAAVVKYQAALNESPDDVALRLALGTAYSHLDRRDETVEQFRWILDHGSPGSPAVVVARAWLLGIGALKEATDASVGAVPEERSPSRGSVNGTTQWPGVSPQERPIPVRVALEGQDDAVGFNLTSRLGQGFEFRSVPPGNYRLRVHAPDRELELWDQMVTVEADRETVVNLTSSMSPVSPRDFPAAATAGVQGGR